MKRGGMNDWAQLGRFHAEQQSSGGLVEGGLTQRRGGAEAQSFEWVLMGGDSEIEVDNVWIYVDHRGMRKFISYILLLIYPVLGRGWRRLLL